MSARLAAAVHVEHPVSREWIVLAPGQEPEPEVAAVITNPDAWQDGTSAADETPEGSPAAASPKPVPASKRTKAAPAAG